MSKFKNKYRIESARRSNFDYQNVGCYFVTICTFQRQHFFGEIVNGEMEYTAVGLITNEIFLAIPRHTKAVCTIDTHQIMPNHVHGIIVIENRVETLHCNVSTTTDPQMSAISPKAGSLSAMIRSYKSAVSYWCNENGHTYFGWQTRFHDRIIRNERELNAIRKYIQENPANWDKDRENDSGLFM